MAKFCDRFGTRLQSGKTRITYDVGTLDELAAGKDTLRRGGGEQCAAQFNSLTSPDLIQLLRWRQADVF